RRHEAAAGHGDLEDLAIDLAAQVDHAHAGDELAIAGSDDVLHVTDIDVLLLRTGLEPALRNLLGRSLRQPGCEEPGHASGHDRQTVRFGFQAGHKVRFLSTLCPRRWPDAAPQRYLLRK